MWVLTTHGFFSAVEAGDGHLKVRSRVYDDARYFAEAVFGPSGDDRIVASDQADYRYRVFVDREQWAQFLADEARSIDYPNFKEAAPSDRHNAYLRVWEDLYSLQRDDARRP